MNIIVNGRFLTHRVTGVERYARELLMELDKIIEFGEIELAIPPETKEIPEYKNIKVERIGRVHNRLWEHISFPLFVKKRKGVSLNLCNVAPIISPDIVCIHDVKIKARPQDFSKKFLIWYNLLFSNETKHAKIIITVSEFSKREIIKYYKVNPNRIVVIPNGWQHYNRIRYDEDTLRKYGLNKGNFYFSIFSLEPNKNYKWLIEVATQIPEQIFAVAGSINSQIFANDIDNICPENIKLLGYVSDKEAKTLMRDCRAFIFPSFYEGFGIPPLEAICSGCGNVIVSDTEVMHEVFGESVNYINPYEPQIPLPVEEKDNSKCLMKYSWAKSAKELLSVIRQVR